MLQFQARLEGGYYFDVRVLEVYVRGRVNIGSGGQAVLYWGRKAYAYMSKEQTVLYLGGSYLDVEGTSSCILAGGGVKKEFCVGRGANTLGGGQVILDNKDEIEQTEMMKQ